MFRANVPDIHTRYGPYYMFTGIPMPAKSKSVEISRILSVQAENVEKLENNIVRAQTNTKDLSDHPKKAQPSPL